MLSLLILFSIKYFRRQGFAGFLAAFKKLNVSRSFLVCLIEIASMVLLSIPSFSQKESLSFKVVQNSTNIGWIRLQKVDTGTLSRIKMDSEVKKRMIFLMSVVEKQDVSFNNGLMIESHVFRKVNADIKMNKHTVYAGNFYEVRSKTSSERVMIKRIQYNQLSLYFREPVNIRQVYSDSFQCFLNIEDNGNSSYKITLPDGNSNYYFYTNGVCSRIRLEHSLFTVDLIRV